MSKYVTWGALVSQMLDTWKSDGHVYCPRPGTPSVVLSWGGEQVELRGRWIIGSRWEIRGQRCWQPRGAGEHASGASADHLHLSIFIWALSCLCHRALRASVPSVPKAYFKRLTSGTDTNNVQILPDDLMKIGSAAAFITGKGRNIASLQVCRL